MDVGTNRCHLRLSSKSLKIHLRRRHLDRYQLLLISAT